MRTLLAGELAQAQSRESDYYVKLEVQNASGTWKDVGALLGSQWIVNATWGEARDTPVSQATFTLVQRVGTASLAPLMSASVLNVDDLGAYAPLLEIGRLVRASTATMPRGVTLDTGKYREVFSGRIDDVESADSEFNNGPITILCLDSGGWLMDLQIETEGTQYGDPITPVALETVLQEVIDDNIPVGEPAVALFKQSSSLFGVKSYRQGETKLLEGLITLVLDSTGEDIRYRYDAAHVSKLTWFNPDRARVTVDATYTGEQYRLSRLDLSIRPIRNAGKMFYVDKTTGTTGFVTATDATSISKYRRRFFRLPASEMLASAAEAQTVINNVVSDLSVSPAEAVAHIPYAWFVQLYDRYTFQANGRQYDQDQTFGIGGYQHTIEHGRGSTVLTCTAKIVGAYAAWHRRITPAVPEEVPDFAPVAQITNLDTGDDDRNWKLRFTGVPGSGGGGANLTYEITRKVGLRAKTVVEAGNATAFPRDLTIARDKSLPTNARINLTDLATGLTHAFEVTLPPFLPFPPDHGLPEEERHRGGDGGYGVPEQMYHAQPYYDETGSQALIDPKLRRFQSALGGPTGIGGDVIERGGNKGDQAIDSGISIVAGAIDFVRAFLNKHLGNISDDATSDRRAATLNQKTGGDRGAAAIDSGNIVVTTAWDGSRAYVGKHLGNMPDDATSDRRAVTADEKTGGGRGFTGLDSNSKLQTGVTAGATAADGEAGIESARAATRKGARAAGSGANGIVEEESTRGSAGGYGAPGNRFRAEPYYDSTGSIPLIDPVTRRVQSGAFGPTGEGMATIEDGGRRGYDALETGGVLAQTTGQRNGSNVKNLAAGRYAISTGTHGQSISFPSNYQNSPAVNILGGISYEPASVWSTNPNSLPGALAPTAARQIDEVLAYNVTASGADLRARLRQASTSTARSDAYASGAITSNGGTREATTANAPANNDSYTSDYTYTVENHGVAGKVGSVTATVCLDYWNGSSWIQVASATYADSDSDGDGNVVISGSDSLTAAVSGLTGSSKFRIRLVGPTGSGGGTRSASIDPGNCTYTTTSGDQYATKTPANLGITLAVEVIGAS